MVLLGVCVCFGGNMQRWCESDQVFAASRCRIVVSLSQQQGDEAEEGVTSEGMTTQTFFVATFSRNIAATPTLRFTFSSFLSFFDPTLSEFDKFLEERAKAAEMTPGLPSPPGGEPAPAKGTPNRKKPERPEDTLLAM